MKKPGIGKRIFNGILAFLLSILLIVVLFITPIWGGAVNTLQHNSIEKIVADTDLSSLIGDALIGSASQRAVQEGQFEQLINGNVFKAMVSCYAENIVCKITGETPKSSLDRPFVEKLLKENTNEIVLFVRVFIPTWNSFSDEMVLQKVNDDFDGLVDTVMSSFPSVDEILEGFDLEEIQQYNILMKPVFVYILLGLCLLIALFIFLLKRWRLAGLMWLAIDNIIVAIPLAVLFFGLRGDKFIDLLIKESPEIENASTLVAAIAKVMSNYIGIFVAALLVIAILFIIIFSVNAKIRNHREAKKAAKAEQYGYNQTETVPVGNSGLVTGAADYRVVEEPMTVEPAFPETPAEPQNPTDDSPSAF